MTGSSCDCACHCGYWPPPQTEAAPADAWWKEAIRHENSKHWYLRPAPSAWANTFGGSQVEDLIKHQIEPPSDRAFRPQGRRVLHEPRESAELGDIMAWDPYSARSQELSPRGNGYVPAAALEQYQVEDRERIACPSSGNVYMAEDDLRRRLSALEQKNAALESELAGIRCGQQRDRPEMMHASPSVQRQAARNRQQSKAQERILHRQRLAEDAWMDRHQRPGSDEMDYEQPIEPARPARPTTPAKLSHARMMQKTLQQPFRFAAPSRGTSTLRGEARGPDSSTFGYHSSRGRARSADNSSARARRAAELAAAR